MALWGNNDNVTTATAGIVTVSGTTVTGTATTFTNYTVGQTITIGLGVDSVAGTGGTAGFAVIKSIASDTSMELVDVDALYSGGDITGVATAFIIGDRPKYLMRIQVSHLLLQMRREITLVKCMVLTRICNNQELQLVPSTRLLTLVGSVLQLMLTATTT